MTASSGRDLSALTSRSAALRGTLQVPTLPVPPATVPTEAPDTADVSSDETARSDHGRKPDSSTATRVDEPRRTASGRPTARTRRRATTQPPDDRDDTVAEAKLPVLVYVPAAYKNQLKDRVSRLRERGTNTSYTEWVLDKLDEHYEQLAAEFTPPRERRSPLPPRPRARRRDVDTPIGMALRPTAAELRVIDDRAAEVGAASRSEFITKVLQLGLSDAG